MKVRLQHKPAAKLADKIAAELADACERIAVAGSIRRGEPTIGDIEVVAVPKLHAANIFGEPDRSSSLLTPRINALVAAGRLLRGRCDGDRYKQLLIPAVQGLALDLFIVEPEAWGVQLAIRTGPADYSKALVRQRREGGLLDDGLAVAQGRLWRSDQVFRGMIDADDYRGPFCHTTGEPFETPEEADFLGYAGGWIEPADRARAVPAQHQRQGVTS